MPDDKKPENLQQEKIGALVIDPIWRMGVAEVDDARLAFIAFDHPQYGQIFYHLSHDSLAGLPKALDKIREALAR